MESFVQIEGIQLCVERRGKGRPLLLIPGLGAGNWLWQRNLHGLAKHFELIMPELRGSGRSDKPDHFYSITLFASDMLELLDALALSRVHVLGASMGGFVAQHFAAKWPERVEKLILVSTSLGGQCQEGPDGETLSRIIRPRGRTRRERLQDAYPFHFSENYLARNAADVERITEWRDQHPQPEFAYYRQLLAGNAYSAHRDAAAIAAPTLVCAGKDDPLVPPINAHRLNERIPRSKLLLFEGKHLFFVEHNHLFNATAVEFLRDGELAYSQEKSVAANP